MALTRPGVTNTPITTGISFLWINWSKTSGALILNAVLIDVQAGRLGRVVLLRHVDPVIADRAGKILLCSKVYLRTSPLLAAPVRLPREGGSWTRSEVNGSPKESENRRPGCRIGGIPGSWSGSVARDVS